VVLSRSSVLFELPIWVTTPNVLILLKMVIHWRLIIMTIQNCNVSSFYGLYMIITALYNLIFGHTQFVLSKSHIPNVFFEGNLPIHCSHGTVTPRASSTNATLWSGVAPGRVLTQSNPPVFPQNKR
jgi:hypothetical protein